MNNTGKVLLALAAVFAVLAISAKFANSREVKAVCDHPEASRIVAPVGYDMPETAPAPMPVTIKAATTVPETSISSEPQVTTVSAPPERAAALDILEDTPLAADVQLAIEQLCADRDLDPAVVAAMIYHESRWDPTAVGDDGCSFGLMQVQPRWHSERMERLGVTDLLDPVGNVTVGIDYLDECLDRYNGDYAAALTAYSSGRYTGTVNGYARTVLKEAGK